MPPASSDPDVPAHPLRDAAWRLAYGLAYRLLRLWWALRRPRRRGVVVAVWCGGRVLILRQSYRPGANFPGGGLEAGEDPEAAARRELREEIRIDIPAGRLRLAAETTVRFESCEDTVSIFELALEAEPPLRPDNREIVAAAFLPPAEALGDPDTPPYVRAYLEGRGAAVGPDCASV
ncbi:NUDIX hydrolase [Dankookia sp. P2]|uniref:NUDIX hydrolase n=1 Tax=Dankookia sp. P2 TaxID=3423955 RepID=UPI003D6665F6